MISDKVFEEIKNTEILKEHLKNMIGRHLGTSHDGDLPTEQPDFVEIKTIDPNFQQRKDFI